MAFTLKTSQDGIDLIFCQPFLEAGFLHAFSTRRGGASFGDERGLNLALTPDHAAATRENQRRFLACLAASTRTAPAEPEQVAVLQQTHSDTIYDVDHEEVTAQSEGDALLARDSRSLLAVKTADCLSVLIADPITGAVAAVHAGWRGTVQRIAQKTLEKMKKKASVDPAACLVALGPSACGTCFEVEQDVIEAFRADQQPVGLFSAAKENRFLLDVKEANRWQLEAEGVSPTRIFASDYCTMHQNDLFFSHRLENGSPTSGGRMWSVIAARPATGNVHALEKHTL